MSAKIRREAPECTNKCRSKDDAARLISVVTEGAEESVVLHRYIGDEHWRKVMRFTRIPSPSLYFSF